jgi:hypothetical protein
MAQPLSLKTVIVPKGQNVYGCDVVRFTADYVASDLLSMCIGCYPPCQDNLFPPISVCSKIGDAPPPVDLRKASDGVCPPGKPGRKKESLLDKLGTSVVESERVPHYWDV